jgi:syntaxin-binding protein 1
MKLLLHAQLPTSDGEVVRNLDLLGARVARPLKDSKPGPPPLFPNKPPPTANAEEYALSRYTTALQRLLEAHIHGALDQTVFPYTKPNTDGSGPANPSDLVTAASLRSAKPTWAKSRLSSVEPRQRVIVFMAGGATYSESRACYEVSNQTSRDVFLVTSHMLTPALFVRQVGDLSVDKRRLGIPAELPKKKAPAHLFERDEPPKPKPLPTPASGKPGLPKAQAPPTAGFASMTLNSDAAAQARPPNGTGQGAHLAAASGKYGKDGEKKKKKKHHFGFGSSK